ncbi:MAG TPA: hypothetical protein VLE43_06950 [Candidatus Saccharimonadia bacterium]|nr:hypothetical protein [Candidatus Saccharimonadia bacterium]
MNGTKIACVVLMMLVASIAYGTQMMHKKAKAMKEEAEMADTDCRAAESASEVANTELIRLKYDSEDLRQFLDEWKPFIKRIQTVQEAEQIFQSLLRNSGILTVSQKFEVREQRDNKMMPRFLQGTLVVEDEFAKAMNWLGEMERKIPLSRITSCRLKQGETGRQINLELRFEIPIINLDAPLDEPPAQ